MKAVTFSIYEVEDPDYLEFIIEYVRKYYASMLFTEEELSLLKPTHHFSPGISERNGCDKWLSEEYCDDVNLENPCVRLDAVEIERRYGLNTRSSISDTQAIGWACVGWVNFNFRTPYIEKEFLASCVDRVLKVNYDFIFRNVCPVCGRLKRTPKAAQCMWCL